MCACACFRKDGLALAFAFLGILTPIKCAVVFYTSLYYLIRTMNYVKWVFGVAPGLCLVLMVAGYLYERISETRDASADPSPGQMVAVGDHRLHLLCTGTVGPTVIIEQGAGEPAIFWWPVQEKVSAFARVCTYDRAGYGWSDPCRASRTIQERAEELHALLVNAAVPGPFVLVAHSYGGLIVRWFAREYRDKVAGLVLVDSRRRGLDFPARMCWTFIPASGCFRG